MKVGPVSQVSTYPTTNRPEKRVIRIPARPTLRLPKIPFWLGALAYAVTGSGVMVFFTR
jgi:hypothetical protein